MKILLQNNWLRVLFLLGAAGICYALGWWQTVLQVETAAPTRVQAASPKAPNAHGTAAHIYFATFAEIRDFLSNPKMSWEDKESYFSQVFYPGINPKDFAALIKLVAGLPSPSPNDKGNILRKLFDGLVKYDPAAAWSLLDDYVEAKRGDRANMIGRILGAIAATDQAMAQSEFAKLSPADAAAAERSFIEALAATDPQIALSEFTKLSPAEAIAVEGSLFSSWAVNDPAAAVAAVLSLPAGRVRNYTIATVASAWAENKDLQSALDWVKSLPPQKSGRMDSKMVEYNLYDWILNWNLYGQAQKYPFDEQKALATLDKMTADSLRDQTIRDVSLLILRHDKDTQLDWINQTATGANYYDAVNAMFDNSNDPGSLTSLVDKVTDPGARAGAIENLANQWDELNPKAALAWAQTLPGSDAAARTVALSTILTNLSKSDPATATAFVQNSADPSVFLPIAPTLAQNLAVTNPAAALTWTESLPDGSAKDQALNNVLVTMAGSDFTTAWNDAAALPENGSTNTIIGNLVGVLAQKDPTQAAGLIAQLPAGTEQVNATNALAAVWVKQDPQAFTVWLTTLPPGDPRDAAIGQLVSSAQATKDPATVAAWINSVNNPQTQAALTQQFNEAQAPK